MTDCNGKEITKGAQVMITGTVLEVSPGNAGNDRLIVRTDQVDPISKASRDIDVNCKQVEIL